MKQALIILALLLVSCRGSLERATVRTATLDSAARAATPSVSASSTSESQPEAKTIVYFYGDSVSSGYGFGTDDSTSPLNTIQGIANILLGANCPNGAYANRNRGQDFNGLCYDAKQGLFHGDDFIPWENAGPTLNDAEMYRKWLELVLFAAQGKAPLILTTTYDHGGFSDYNAPLGAGV